MDWYEEYRKVLFKENATEDDIKWATDLKLKNIPDFLYKYYLCDDIRIKTFELDHLWLSDPKVFNDPFDCAFTGSLASSPNNMEFVMSFMNHPAMREMLGDEQIEKIKSSSEPYNMVFDYLYGKTDAAENLKREIFEMFQDLSSELIAESSAVMKKLFKVCCFSTVMDSILMWSHYGKNHSGFCVAYDFKKVEPNHYWMLKALHPVSYVNEMFDATKFIERRILGGHFADQIALVKSNEWQYEKEWRLVFGSGAMAGQNYCDAPPVSHVYLGATIDEPWEEMIRSVCKSKNIPVKSLGVSHKKFKLIEIE